MWLIKENEEISIWCPLPSRDVKKWKKEKREKWIFLCERRERKERREGKRLAVWTLDIKKNYFFCE